MILTTNVENGFVEITNDTNGELELKRDDIYITTLPKKSFYRDYTVESGKTYEYSLGSVSKTITLHFEYIFLSDANRQLKIKYNPKVSGFKDTILEQKVETIGSTYPFIFRNANVRYKEIQLSGLISYQMDEEDSFDLGISVIDTGLNDKNYYKERKFREKFYNWLTNGEPKLFRSPQEGNYIIQLMNVSLTPVDQLGRLLYSFNATGYEIMKYDIQKMLDNKIMAK